MAQKYLSDDKLFAEQRGPPPKKNKLCQRTLAELVKQAQRNIPSSIEKENKQRPKTSEAELDRAKRVLKNLEDTFHYKNRCYIVTELTGDVVGMETGLPTKEVFNIVV